ncbi:hypothetical protein GCM10007884_25930 [Methylobacterium brachythecii]|uniref:Transposase n=1 Tax=Methylobacterium brachythecii TaxID=1176177 RepID=A0ABQ6D7P1_9HYPH|nr:hypothetical protein GCM10007884_25930 [Methylobacterium brachythecii]
MTIGFAKTEASVTRSAVAWNVEVSASTSRENCFGMLSREAGHNRVPDPPQRITGRTRSTLTSDIGSGRPKRQIVIR